MIDKPKARQRAILYARFSPRPGAATCESCESQLDDLRNWCADRDIEVVGEFSDKALSGGDEWSDRPGMLDAVTMAKRGMLFLVRAYDRLFRDTDKALAFRSMLEAKGVEVRSISEEGANGDSMNSKLIRFIFLWIAEYQREVIRARTKCKMLQHQAGGRRMSAEPPWGKSVDPNDNSRLIDNPEEMETAETIRSLRMMGESLRGISKILEQNGVQHRGKSQWHHVLVRRILNRIGEK